MSFTDGFPRDSASLITMLNDSDPLTREWAAYALGRASKKTKDLMLALGESLFDTEDEVCIAAAVSLFGWGILTTPAIPHLIKAIQHRNLYVRRIVIGALSLIGPDARDALPAIMEQLKSPDHHIRMWSAAVLKNVAPDIEKEQKSSS